MRALGVWSPLRKRTMLIVVDRSKYRKVGDPDTLHLFARSPVSGLMNDGRNHQKPPDPFRELSFDHLYLRTSKPHSGHVILRPPPPSPHSRRPLPGTITPGARRHGIRPHLLGTSPYTSTSCIAMNAHIYILTHVSSHGETCRPTPSP